MSRTVWTVIGVIAAVLIAWFIVDVVFSVLWFIVKLAIVAVVAVAVPLGVVVGFLLNVVVFFVLRALFRSSD